MYSHPSLYRPSLYRHPRYTASLGNVRISTMHFPITFRHPRYTASASLSVYQTHIINAKFPRYTAKF